MFSLSFRQIFPKGLYARSVLLSLVPVLSVLAMMTVYYFNGHLRTVNTKLSQSLARQVSLIQETCELNPDNMSIKASLERRLNINYECNYLPDDGEAPQEARFFYSELVRQQMHAILGSEIKLYTISQARQLDIRVPTASAILRVIVDRKRAIDINGHVFIVWVVLISLLMIFTVLAFLRNHVRSILRLADAAQAFGRGQELEGFRPSGAREVRAAANAVIEMRQRLIGFAEQRTMMLAGVSHDLRTPLTRLQLQLAMQEQTEDVLQAREDIRDMETMLEEYLAFARGDGAEEAALISMSALVESVVRKFPRARLIIADTTDHNAMVRASALKRAISNLLQNATTYGEIAEVQVRHEDGHVVIIVDDNGPGISEASYEDAVRPFARLNEARTQNMPGVGLGLALARDTAHIHGGSITLDRSPLGGLRVAMHLPA